MPLKYQVVFFSSRQINKFLRFSQIRKLSVFRKSAQHFGNKQPNWMTAEEAIRVVKSDDTLYVHGAAATPTLLVHALAEHGKKADLKNVTICQPLTTGAAEYNQPEYEGIFRGNSFFVGANIREAVYFGKGDFIPISASESPLLFDRKIIPINVCLVQVTPADEQGYCSLGTSVESTWAAFKNAKYTIGQVNPCLPRTFGDATIHVSELDALVEGKCDLPELKPEVITEVEHNIGKLIAENLVEDGATLQLGIGSIPDAVAASLKNHKDLGIHSEMFSDGVVDLVNNGCINNKYKPVYTGYIVASFTMGTRKLYDFLDNNPNVVMLRFDYVNNIQNIALNPRMTAINSCIEIDITGQVCSDSIGTMIYSGVGGQIDFLRGAAMAKDGKGKPILAMPSCTKKGKSKIVPFIKTGGGVVTPRSDVHYVVTEYGIADLFGKNLRQRAFHLIQIAHPMHREILEKAAFDRLKCFPSP